MADFFRESYPRMGGVRRFGVAMLLSCTIVVGSAQPSHACWAIIGPVAAAALEAVTLVIEEAYLLINQGFESLYQPHVLKANQTTNDTQHQANAEMVRNDKKAAQISASELAEERAEIAKQMSTPSRVACRHARLQQRYQAMNDDYKDKMSDDVEEDTDYGFAKPGTVSENGTLAAMHNAWEDRCTKYADVTNMYLPSGVTCAGGSADMVNLDIKPMDAILSPESFDGSDREEAARDAMKMLIEIAPPDPMRGAALSRVGGQNIYVRRNKEMARMNLARMIVDSAIADRMRNSVSGSGGMPADSRDVSRRERFREMFEGEGTRNTTTGRLDTDPAKKLTDMSGVPENGNVQTVIAAMDGYQVMLLRLIQLTEQMVAVEAVRLASVVDETSSSGSSLQMRSAQ